MAMPAPPLVILCVSLDPCSESLPRQVGAYEIQENTVSASMRRPDKVAAPASPGERRGENATPTTFAEK